MFRFCFSCATVAYSAASLRPEERCMRCGSDRLAATAIRSTPGPRALLLGGDGAVIWATGPLLDWLGLAEPQVAGRRAAALLGLERDEMPPPSGSLALGGRVAVRGRPTPCVAHLVWAADGRVMAFVWDPEEVAAGLPAGRSAGLTK